MTDIQNEPMLITVTIQIGNSDNKLPQIAWSHYCNEIKDIVTKYAEKIHFQGGSDWNAPWQNACIVCEMLESYEKDLLRDIRACRQEYSDRLPKSHHYNIRNDISRVAVSFGETEFV